MVREAVRFTIPEDNIFTHSSLAQSVEHLTVNQGVTGSSPVGGAIYVVRKDYYTRKVLVNQGLFVFLGVKNNPLSSLHLFLNLMDLNLRLYRTFEKSLLF